LYMHYIGVDVGGTQLRVALIDPQKGILDFESFPVPKNYDEGVEIILNTSKKFLNKSGQKIEAVGIALPGLVGEEVLISASNLPEWAEKPLVKDLQFVLKVPIKLVHDVAAAALGEATF